MQISDHLKGILLTTIGVIILSPDAILMRLLYADTWTLAFWRGIAFATGITTIMLLLHGKNAIGRFIATGKAGLLISLVFSCSILTFTFAIQNTSIANTLIIISTSPMFAALLSRFFLGEKISLNTWVAIFIILAAIMAISFNSLESGDIYGDISALGTAMCIAISFTLMRRHKEVNMVPAMALSGIIVAVIASLIIFAMGGTMKLKPEAIPYLIMMGIVTSTAFAFITLGPRYISAPEVSLIMPLETVMGSYLAWVFLSEAPSIITIIGGLIVILTLTIHSWLSLKKTH